MIRPNELESLGETLAVLSGSQLMEQQVHEGEAELERGEEGTTLEDLKADLDVRGARE